MSRNQIPDYLVKAFPDAHLELTGVSFLTLYYRKDERKGAASFNRYTLEDATTDEKKRLRFIQMLKDKFESQKKLQNIDLEVDEE